jgi:hypothetical protein
MLRPGKAALALPDPFGIELDVKEPADLTSSFDLRARTT